MIKLRISIFSETWGKHTPHLAPSEHHVVWVLSGSILVDGITTNADQGTYINSASIIDYSASLEAKVIRFVVTPEIATPQVFADSNTLLSRTFDIEHDVGILRLDRVTFPASAVAYRHTHAGAGIRYLLCGKLQVIADDHTQHMETGQSWYENSYSPVKAIAAPKGVTEFIRVMVLPEKFAGKPTIELLNAEDEGKPKLQCNTRYFDKQLNFANKI